MYLSDEVQNYTEAMLDASRELNKDLQELSDTLDKVLLSQQDLIRVITRYYDKFNLAQGDPGQRQDNILRLLKEMDRYPRLKDEVLDKVIYYNSKMPKVKFN